MRAGRGGGGGRRGFHGGDLCRRGICQSRMPALPCGGAVGVSSTWRRSDGGTGDLRMPRGVDKAACRVQEEEDV